MTELLVSLNISWAYSH